MHYICAKSHFYTKIFKKFFCINIYNLSYVCLFQKVTWKNYSFYNLLKNTLQELGLALKNPSALKMKWPRGSFLKIGRVALNPVERLFNHLA